MPIEQHPFGEIVMDFVGQLAESAGFNAIQVVADQFTKVQNYIAVKTTHIAEDVANSYMDNIWQLYVLLQHWTSDWGLQLASKFLTELNQKLNINLHLSTTCNPQTDRLYE